MMNNTSYIHGAPRGHDVRIMAAQVLALKDSGVLGVYVASDDRHARQALEYIKFFLPTCNAIYLPAWDCLPYDRVSPSRDIVGERLHALQLLQAWQGVPDYRARFLITTVNALIQRLPPPDFIYNSRLVIERKGRIDSKVLIDFLESQHYHRVSSVREGGEYAVRGGLIDIFAPNMEQPVRIDLFGDEVESLRMFDAHSQRSENNLERVELGAVREIPLDQKSIERFRQNYRTQFGVIKDDPLYESVSAGRAYNGMEHWQSLFFEEMVNLDAYWPDGNIQYYFDEQTPGALESRLAQIEDYYQARRVMMDATPAKGHKILRYNAIETDALYWNKQECEELQGHVFVGFKGENEGAQAGHGHDYADIRAKEDGDVFGVLKKDIAAHQKEGKAVCLALYSAAQRLRVRGILENSGVDKLVDVHSGDDIKRLKAPELGLCVLELERGFVASDLVMITEQDIFGDRLTHRQNKRKRKKADQFIREISALNAGDLVVHVDHGVGRFEGLEALSVQGTVHDCLKLVYAGDDRLFLPVENIEMLSRYGSDEGAQLDKLGGPGWKARKAKVKKDLMAMAEALLKIAAERLLRKATPAVVSQSLYDEFAARFPYDETEDQARAIRDVMADLAANKPMDRLVCGDVGFGKTEVAMRGAFAVAMAGQQVAVIAPTTLLARQHYQNFVERFKGMGVRIAPLSRLVNAKEAAQNKADLAVGKVQIIIGTHALLAKDVEFQNLGLVVVDEEQRFGVKQKERLKELRNNVHLLTLTATPIPRTLQQGLAGVREMSLITTPPVDRLAIRSFVLPYDPVVVREALLREHYRGGQTFYVCPRIKDMEAIEKELKELVPELRVIAAHGAMPPRDLEERMSAFLDHEYDLLLATNIIESGIDVPNANTMIVHRSDLFGLAQLYQIRGRIGRSKSRAYAYLTYDPYKALNEKAQKRLEVLETLDTLGAGFQLASHDMDIRGSGNLLGEEQSGHIREIGVELYQKMLSEAVDNARAFAQGEEAQGGEAEWSPTINMGISVIIPEHYVDDLAVRMSLYRRLGDIENEDEMHDFKEELLDRFGPVPEEFQNLLDIITIKQYCRASNIERLDVGPKGAVITFHDNIPANPQALIAWMSQRPAVAKLRPDQKLVIVQDWTNLNARVAGCQKLLQTLAQL